MGKHYETNANGVLTNAGRAARASDRAAKSKSDQDRIKATRAQGEKDSKAGEGAANYDTARTANDAERERVGTKNKEGALTGTSSARVNKALDKANVGAND